MSGVCKSSPLYVCVCVVTVQQRSDLGAVGARRGRKHVRGTVVTQGGGALWADGRVLVVGMETQPLPSVTHVVCESGTERVW